MEQFGTLLSEANNIPVDDREVVLLDAEADYVRRALEVGYASLETAPEVPLLQLATEWEKRLGHQLL